MTRLHIKYDLTNFPEDLQFQTTKNKSFFQGRYIIRHPYIEQDPAKESCSHVAKDYEQYPEFYSSRYRSANAYKRDYWRYRLSLPRRYERNAQTLSELTTGWNILDIRQKMAEHNSK